jgi:hypothetical protein
VTAGVQTFFHLPRAGFPLRRRHASQSWMPSQRRTRSMQRPFDTGPVALISLFGAESWSDYVAVVLQMAMLDTLTSIDGQLTELLDRLAD